MVQDIYTGSTGSKPYDLTSMNNKLYFAADDGTHGVELWDPPPVIPPPANIDVSNDNHVQQETSIDVNPLNPQNLVAAAIDSSNGSQNASGFAVNGYYSRDGGNTWAGSGRLPLDVQGQHFELSADPSVAFDGRGNVYVVYNAVNEGYFFGNKGVGAIAVAKSTDGGATFTQVTAVEFNPNTDHPKIAVDKDPASPYRDDIYVTWEHFFSASNAHFSILRSRSTDGGLTWSAPADVSDDPGQTWWNATAVGPEGNVYATWMGAINPAGGATQFVDRSTDGGLTFGFWSGRGVLVTGPAQYIRWPQPHRGPARPRHRPQLRAVPRPRVSRLRGPARSGRPALRHGHLFAVLRQPGAYLVAADTDQ